MKLSNSLAGILMVCLAAPAFAGGNVKGTVTFAGDSIPARGDNKADIQKHPDKDMCDSPNTLKDDLIIDSATKGIQNVFVSIEKVTGGKTLEVPSAPIVSDQKTCHFTPHILVVPKGGSVELKNSDTKLHNTHFIVQKNAPFNEGIPAGKSSTVVLKETEKIKVTCDVHPWMLGYIVVTDTPYYAVTTADGSFEIKDLPAGKWTIKLWHETLGTSKQEVNITDGKTEDIKIKMEQKKS